MYNIKHDYTENSETNTFSFFSHEIPLCILNSIRRILLTDIKTFAVSDIDIIKNTSALNDDIMNHRISLIPIICTEQLSFELHKKNNDDIIQNVFLHDLKCYTLQKKYHFNPEILLCKLKKDQELHFKFKTEEDIGKTNIKFRSVNAVILKKIIVIKYTGIHKDKIFKFMEETYDMKKETYYNDPNILGIIDTGRTNLDFNDIINRELKISENVTMKDYIINNNLVHYFSIESDYHNPKDLFYKTFDVLINRLKSFDVKKKLTNYYNGKYFYNIDDDCATTGNVLSYFMNKNDELEYVYYVKKFPSDKNIELQVFFKKNNPHSQFIVDNLISNTIEYIIKILSQLNSSLTI